MSISLVRAAAASQDWPVAEVQVGIAELKVAVKPARLITLGLGSCVGIALYDQAVQIGGLLHVMLPDSTQFINSSKAEKFADLGIPLLAAEMMRIGGRKSRMQAKLVGGAQMFTGLNEKFALNIGERNIKAAREALGELNISILAEEVGGCRGRTMILDTVTGQVLVRTLGSETKVI